MINIVQSILVHNAGRESERLRLKYANMREDAFTFLRGTCHLFYARLPEHPLLSKAPSVWSCGDLHVENFGSYLGDPHRICFDVNDVDEGTLAPLSWDVVRFLASLLVGAQQMQLNADKAESLCHTFLDAYNARLASGESRQVAKASASGLLRKLLDQVADRTRADFLDKRTRGSGAGRRIKIREGKMLAALPGELERISTLLDTFAQTQPDRESYQVVDVGRRIAGTGSLGVERDVVLVRGEGGADGHYLLDLKRALPSSLLARLGAQRSWHSEAERVVTLQSRMQAVPVARLHAIVAGDKSYLLRALLPSEDRVSLSRNDDTFASIAAVIRNMGDIAASAHLRGAGQDHAATTEQLIAFAHGPPWQADMVKLALRCAEQVEADWKTYCHAYDERVFSIA